MPERFELYVSAEPNSGCHLWLGAYIKKGYGMFAVTSKNVRLATHVSLELDGRPRPDSDSMALHKCDVPACVNPAHLYWGTARDNFTDMVSRGRGKMDSTRKTHCIRGHCLEETSYTRGNGYRQCRACEKTRVQGKRTLVGA